jgi:hypothetical protein
VHIVLRTLLRIAEHVVGLGEQPEPFAVPGSLVIRMETLGEQPVHAVDGVWFRVGADLQHLVVVGREVFRHPD